MELFPHLCRIYVHHLLSDVLLHKTLYVFFIICNWQVKSAGWCVKEEAAQIQYRRQEHSVDRHVAILVLFVLGFTGPGGSYLIVTFILDVFVFYLWCCCGVFVQCCLEITCQSNFDQYCTPFDDMRI